MVDVPYNIILRVIDETGGTLDAVQSKLSGVKDQVDQTTTASNNLARSTTASSESMGKNMLAVTTLAASAYMAYDNIERVQLRVEKSDVALVAATNNVQDAQKKVDDAYVKFGATSEEYVKAVRDLEEAQMRLQVRTDAARLAHQDFDRTLVTTASVTIPSIALSISTLMGKIGGLQTALTSLGGGTTAAGGAGVAGGLGILGAGIAVSAAELTGFISQLGRVKELIMENKTLTSEFSANLTTMTNPVGQITEGFWAWGKALKVIPENMGSVADTIVAIKDKFLELLGIKKEVEKPIEVPKLNPEEWKSELTPPIVTTTPTTPTTPVSPVAAWEAQIAELKKKLEIPGLPNALDIGSQIMDLSHRIQDYYIRGGHAEGGIVTAPTLALVGEKGPEAIIPLNSAAASSYSLQKTEVTFNINVRGATTTDLQFANEVARQLAQLNALKSSGRPSYWGG